VVLLVALPVALPVYWVILTAVRRRDALYAVPPKLLPVAIDPGAVAEVFRETEILHWMGTSLLLSTASTAAATLLGVPAGYALSRHTSRSARAYASGVLVTQMMPPLLLLVPIFVVFRESGLTDSLTGLIVADTAVILPLAIWMSKAMIDQIPRELDEAAMVDGCSPWRVLVSVIMPVCRPGLAAVAIYGFIEVWDEFLFAKTLIVSPDRWPASVGLYSFEGQDLIPVNLVMAAAILFTLPPLVLFLITRRGLVAGLAAGAVKG
jgi:multiple sugar transport system permease protein